MVSYDDPDLRTLLNWGRDRLKDAGISDHTISAEVILRHLLKLSRSEMILSSARKIDAETAQEYKELIEKRSNRYPLQYLTGSVEFYNVKLRCDSRALIPRPETEILVETVITALKDRKQPSILDIGTGSGNIAIALAKNLPGSRVTGIDISKDALDLAAANVELNGVQDQVTLVAADIRDELMVSSLGAFDCAVSNPPYVAENDAANLQPEVIEFEPRIALFSPGGPLGFFESIIKVIPLILKPGGLLAVEMPFGRVPELIDLFSVKFAEIEIRRDLAGIERVLTGVYSPPG